MIRRKNPPIDDDLLRRIDSVHSGLAQARIHAGQWDDPARARAAEALNELGSCLERARHAQTSSTERLRLITQVDAELCLYEPRELLKADRVRIEDRFFRLSETARAKWTAILGEYKANTGNEHEYRQLLRSLTYEVAQAGANFERLTSARRKALVWITAWTAGAFLVLGFLFFEVFSASVSAIGASSAAALDAMVRALSASTETSWSSPLLSFLLAGMLGAMIFVFQSVLQEEKLRPENILVLVLNILIRVGFGAVYAFVAVVGVLTEFLPLKLPSGGEQAFMFLTLIAVAAGLSDKLFGEVIGKLMERKKESTPKPNRD